jgi:hypothetical protein
MVDTDKFKEMTACARRLREDHTADKSTQDAMTDMYFLRDDKSKSEMRRFENVVETYSPDAANAIETAVRLMSNNYPNYNVPEALHKAAGQNVTDKIEELSAAWMRISDRVRGTPVHVDGARSGLLYDRIYITVNATATLLARAQGAAPGVLGRIERVARITPYLFDVHDPRDCYADFDGLGLRVFARLTKMTAQQIREAWGSQGAAAVGREKGNARTEYEVWTMYDLEHYACWIDGAREPIHCEPHGLAFIPVVVHTVEGSRMFAKADEQSRPLLYTLWKSQIWRRQNMLLSAIMTRAQTRLWAALVYEAEPGDPNPEIDLTQPLSMVRIQAGRKLAPLPVDPALNELWQAYQLVNQKGEESTVYKQVSGQPVRSGDATYSETALLNQAGRLPLTAITRKLGWALGDALRLAFLWYKQADGYGQAEQYGIDPASIPDDLEVEVTLDPVQPYERLQLASIYQMLKDDYPQEYLMETLMGNRQPRRLIKQLWKQRITEQLIAQRIQQMTAPPQPPAQPPPPEPMGAPGAMIPPEMLAGGMQGPDPLMSEALPAGAP